MKIDSSFQNYNVFLISLAFFIVSMCTYGITKKLILITTCLLLAFFVYHQFILFPLSAMDNMENIKIILSNVLFACFAIYMIYYIIRYNIIL